jgi:hypothetical protein
MLAALLFNLRGIYESPIRSRILISNFVVLKWSQLFAFATLFNKIWPINELCNIYSFWVLLGPIAPSHVLRYWFVVIPSDTLFIRICLKSETYLKYQSDALAFVMMLKRYDKHVRWSLFFIIPTHAPHYTLTLKPHIKTLKIRPYMFQSPLKPSSGGPWPYFFWLLNWNVDLHLL